MITFKANIWKEDDGRMEMTIKQLANELGVGKTTINRVITQLDLQDKLHRVGNKYMLSEMQIEQIKLKMMIIQELHQSNQESHQMNQELHQTNQELHQSNQESHQTNQELHQSNQEIQILVLKEQLSMLDRQLTVKDNQIQMLQEQLISKDIQITEKDRQIKLLQEQLIAKDNQIGQITTAMESMATALTAEQALHAGTIQKQLTEHSVMEQQPSDEEQPKQKQGLFTRLFGRKQN